ncbi:succinate dehydrogenase, cytochrome b556 subunit [Castellaniella sp.]|uniref:succinate dehydrogenase, cytochrome b556 subunit n=1 Tax=Castellaniella sp. TaxID=1955812 RepID=UPI003A91A020
MPNTRPLSPHLSIYRWRVNMLQSTLHRLTGLLLCIGTLLFTWGLIAAGTGEAAWRMFAGFCSGWFGVLLLILWTWSLSFHLCNGIQHLARDTGKNFGPPTRNRTHKPVYWSTGWVVILASMLLTALVWILLALQAGGSL